MYMCKFVKKELVGETITKRELENIGLFFYEPDTIFILVMLVCHKYRHRSVTRSRLSVKDRPWLLW